VLQRRSSVVSGAGATLLAIGVHGARRNVEGWPTMGNGTLRGTSAAGLLAAGLLAAGLLAAGLLVAGATAAPAAASGANATAPRSAVVGCFLIAGPSRICDVEEPVVTRPATGYDLRFNAGDRVKVEAGGCVQTGGHGDTWKRYVDPSSDNGLYHGTISLPGVTNGLTELRFMVGQTFVVPFSGDLVLGYEDDGYSDNGYYSHDNGTGNQCKGVGNAFVSLTITAGT
jgi:hypothetical protein